MLSDAPRILKVVQAETLAGTGVRVRFKNDASSWENGNVAYLSDAGIDQDTQSFFFIMELAPDCELEPVTKQRAIHVAQSGLSENPPQAKRADTHHATRASISKSYRVSAPLPLPPPLLPSPSRVSQGPLPPLNPPPERPFPKVAPPSPPQASRALQVAFLVVVAIVAGGIVLFWPSRKTVERWPEKTDLGIAQARQNVTPIATESIAPNQKANLTTFGEPGASGTGMATNWVPSETASGNSEETPPKTALRAEAEKQARQKTTPSIQKAPTVSHTPASTKRRRESIF